MNFNKATAVSILVLAQLTSALVAGTAFAGFDFSTTGQTIGNYTRSDKVQPMAPSASASKTPALQIFQDKYLPDTIRKKYGVKDDWYGDVAPISPVPSNNAMENTITWDEPSSSAPVALQSPPAEIVDTWRARKGENLRDVLQRWSTRADTNLMWASVDAPNLPKDFSMVGKFQDAVNALIKEAGGDTIHSQYRAEGMNPVMTTMASTVTTSAPAPLPNNIAVVPEKKNIFSQVFAPEVKKDVKPETRWFGLAGAPLAEVIRVWADDAGVTLIWQSEKNFALKDSVSQVGTFEDAVFQALSQYDDEDIRPVGEMYNDPQSNGLANGSANRQVLVVRTDIAQQ